MNKEMQALMEKVQALESEVKDLKENKVVSRYETPWYQMTKYIEEQLDKNISTDSAFKYKLKTAITSLVGKSFRKNNVMALNEAECEEAKKFIDFIINFMKETRKKSYVENAPQGYERKVNYKE
jgi:hypothetical protein